MRKTFKPSHDGFKFINNFTKYGLCGGMTLMAADRYRRCALIPQDAAPGAALFNQLCRWQVESIMRGARGFLQAWWSSDRFTWSVRQWSEVLRRLYYGPVPISLVWYFGTNLWTMAKENHQVLAYAGPSKTLHVYDCNNGPIDNVTIHLDYATRTIVHSDYPNDPILALFVT